MERRQIAELKMDKVELKFNDHNLDKEKATQTCVPHYQANARSSHKISLLTID